MKPYLVVIGTRPEAIKLAPLCMAMKTRKIKYKILLTGQHKDMANDVLPLFGLKADFILNTMGKNQTLARLSSKLFNELDKIFIKNNFQGVFVQGDTTSSFIAGISSFYNHLPVYHIEAGLRTGTIYSPFPEEFNRKGLSLVAEHNFCPTKKSKENLLGEGISNNKISVVGNTIVDAIKHFKVQLKKHTFSSKNLQKKQDILNDENIKKILLTMHRRENHQHGIEQVCSAINKLTSDLQVHIFFPIHPNPNVKKVVETMFKANRKVTLLEPLTYFDLLKLMNKADLVLSDSGGLQEESPSFNKPILVLRDSTERPEIIDAGGGLLVGTNEDKVYNVTREILENKKKYKEMSGIKNPFGDGNTSMRIINKIKSINEK